MTKTTFQNIRQNNVIRTYTKHTSERNGRLNGQDLHTVAKDIAKRVCNIHCTLCISQRSVCNVPYRYTTQHNNNNKKPMTRIVN